MNRPGQMLYDSLNAYLYMLTGGCGLAIIDTRTSNLVGNLTVCSGPAAANGSVFAHGLILDPLGGRLYVWFVGASNLTMIDLQTGKMTGNLPTRSEVIDGAFVPGTGSLYLTETYDGGSSLDEVNPTNGSVMESILLEAHPEGASDVYYLPTLAELVATVPVIQGTNTFTNVSFIDPTSNHIIASVTVNAAPSAIYNPTEVALDPDNGLLYLSQGSYNIPIVDVQRHLQLGNVSMGDFQDWAPINDGTLMDSDNDEIYVADQNYGVSIVNGTSSSIMGYIPLFDPLPSCPLYGPYSPQCQFSQSLSNYMAFVPSEGVLYATVLGSDQLYIIPPGVVTFHETGLPPGTNWSVSLGGLEEHSNTNYTTFIEPNGTYSFSVPNVDGLGSLTSSGTVHVHGFAIWIVLNFTTAGLSWEEWLAIMATGVVLALAAVVLVRWRRAHRKEAKISPREFL